jgi:hypothetical protein
MGQDMYAYGAPIDDDRGATVSRQCADCVMEPLRKAVNERTNDGDKRAGGIGRVAGDLKRDALGEVPRDEAGLDGEAVGVVQDEVEGGAFGASVGLANSPLATVQVRPKAGNTMVKSDSGRPPPAVTTWAAVSRRPGVVRKPVPASVPAMRTWAIGPCGAPAGSGAATMRGWIGRIASTIFPPLPGDPLRRGSSAGGLIIFFDFPDGNGPRPSTVTFRRKIPALS